MPLILETIRYIERMPRNPWQFIVMFHDTCEFSIGHYPIICVRITWAHFTNTYLLIKKILHSSNSVAGFVITTNSCICHESTSVVVLEKIVITLVEFGWEQNKFSISSQLWGNLFITHYGLVMPYGNIIWVNFRSCNGLLPDGTKPLPEPILTNHPVPDFISQSSIIAITL